MAEENSQNFEDPLLLDCKDQDQQKSETMFIQISFLAALVGTVLLYSNFILFQPYFTAIFLAWILAVPLHSLKKNLTTILKEDLSKASTAEVNELLALKIISRYFISGFCEVFLGRYLAVWAVKKFNVFAFGDPKETVTSGEPPALKLRPLDESNSTQNSKSDPFQNLNATPKDSLSTPSTPTKSTASPPIIASLKGLISRPDWRYLYLTARCCLALRLIRQVYFCRDKLIVGIALLAGTRILGAKFEVLRNHPLTFIKNWTQQKAYKVANRAEAWVRSDINGAVTLGLIAAILGTMLGGGYFLLEGIFAELKNGLLTTLLGLFRFGVDSTHHFFVKLANGDEELATLRSQAEGFLSSWAPELDVVRTAEYFLSPDFKNQVATIAPTSWALFYKGAKPDPTLIFQEAQAIINEIVLKTGLNIDSSLLDAGKPMLTPLALGLGTFSSSFIWGVVAPSAVYILDLVFQLLVFTTVLWALVERSLTPLHPPPFKKHQQFEPLLAIFSRLISPIFSLIEGICLFTFQMGLFHFMFAWATLHITGGPFPITFSLLAGFIAIVPIGGPYIAALPPAIFMWYFQTRRLWALILVVSHFAAAFVVDPTIYSTHLPAISPFFISLAAYLGHLALGLKGLFLGPFLLALIPCLFAEFFTEKKDTPTP